MIGLLAGVGIPSGSIGVPPDRALLAFWPQALERLRVLLQLQQHLHRLVEFVGRNSGLIVPNEATEVQQVRDEITKLLELCLTPSSNASDGCRHLDSQTDQISHQLLSLMHRFQKRILLTASESKLHVLGISLLCMWVVSDNPQFRVVRFSL
ncbi:unnamed protein product [Dibothriocephalus latus]|uniref:Uncharacterized protein n=1 Tax=Dibothriocephalus latus TaxID=60516 RepID=A0A3P7M5T9_DIBLA|nr:unnamed protein product [Dibothriocephalus latus]